LILQTFSGKIPAVHQPEKYILIEIYVIRSSLKLESSPQKGKITFIKKAMLRTPYKFFYIQKTHRVSVFQYLQTYSGEIKQSSAEKYIKTEMNVKKGSPKSQNPPKGKDHFY
jgi:hypothetical protein